MSTECNLFVGLGRVGVVRALLEAGADAAVSHKDGWNAITHAKDEGVIAALEKAGLKRPASKKKEL